MFTCECECNRSYFTKCEHFTIDIPDPIETVKFCREQMGNDYRTLIDIISQRTRVYEVIRRNWPLSLATIRSINAKLRILSTLI